MIQRPFFVEYKSIVWQTFTIIFVSCLVITLFTRPIYRAVSVVVFPEGADSKRQLLSLAAPPMGDTVVKSVRLPEGVSEPYLRVVAMQTGGGAYLAVESEDPETAADLANRWARAYTYLQPGRIVREAALPQHPVRPQKALRVLFGAIAGFLFGMFFAFLRSLKGDKTEKVRGKPGFPNA